MTNQETVPFTSLDEQYFGEYFPPQDRIGSISQFEAAVVEKCLAYVSSRFASMKYILGLALDFALLAQCLRKHDSSLSRHDPNRTEGKIFERYTLVTSRGNRQANTLTLKHGDNSYGIRKLEELVLQYFYVQRKLGYPSAYVYNTGQWAKFKDLLVDIFSLSSKGRFELFIRLLAFGNSEIPEKSLFALSKKPVGDFTRLLLHYQRTHPGENGGLAFQAIVYGFVSLTYSHLNVSASSVRTGSSRQHRVGDIDAYAGEFLVASIEVKDMDISEENFDSEVGGFARQIAMTDVLGIVVCRDCTSESKRKAKSIAPSLIFISEAEIQSISSIWDDKLHNKAVEGALHFLSNIEHNEAATRRMQAFLRNQES